MKIYKYDKNNGTVFSSESNIKEKIWTLEKVREGFNKFHEINGRYPTAYEVDDFDSLPSSRQIQRNWGGLVALRKQLGLSINDYSSGASRSTIAKNVGSRGKELELIVRDYLHGRFREPFVHIERPIHQTSKDRFDFYIYAKPKCFAIDVFGTIDIRRLIKIMTIKEAKYSKDSILKSDELLYFIYFSDHDLKSKIDEWLLRRKNKFPENWRICTFDEFKNGTMECTCFNVA